LAHPPRQDSLQTSEVPACHSETELSNQPSQYFNGWIKLGQLDKFIGLVRLIDRPRAHNQGFQAEFLQPGCFRGESNGVSGMASKLFTGFDQSGIGRSFERWHAIKERLEFQGQFPAVRDRLNLAQDGLAQGFHVHARQRAQIKVQLALGTDTVWIVTTVDAAKVQGWKLYLEVRVPVLFLPA